MLAIAAHSDVLQPVSHSAHPAHTVASALGAEFTIPVGHPHVDNDLAEAHHEAFPLAMLTKSSFAPALVVLGLVAALVVIGGSLAAGVVPAGRGPPGGLAGARTGRELLTRFCISRR